MGDAPGTVDQARDLDEQVECAGDLLAELECTGLKPHFLEKMAANGVAMPPNFFS